MRNMQNFAPYENFPLYGMSTCPSFSTESFQTMFFDEATGCAWIIWSQDETIRALKLHSITCERDWAWDYHYYTAIINLGMRLHFAMWLLAVKRFVCGCGQVWCYYCGGHCTSHKFLDVSEGMKLLGSISSFPAAYGSPDLSEFLLANRHMHNKQ